jgi:hypothetical protein
MTSKKKALSPAEQQERLSSPVNKDLHGEDPAIAALAKIPEMTNLEALDIAVALQKILRGQEVQGEELAKLRQEMARIDKNAKRYEEDREKWLEEINRKADQIRMSESERDKLVATESGRMKKLIEDARAQAVVERQMFDHQLDTEPKVMVTSPGELALVREGPSQVAKLLPEVIGIKHRKWILMPGVPTMVPQTVADRIAQKRRQAVELEERKKAMQAGPDGKFREAHEIEASMMDLDGKYNSSTQRVESLKD